MAKYGMAIDLNRCVGCGTCGLACKTENNTDYKQGGISHNWADFLTFNNGSYANGNFQFTVLPVLCNHCTEAPCVESCPTGALFKDSNNITMHDESKCTGEDCGHLCITACPFSNLDIDAEGVQYSVLHANPKNQNTHALWDDNTPIITGGTANPAEVVTGAGSTRPPYKNAYTHPYYSAVRPSNVVEKCFFCDHRLQNSELPFCVVSCPANARIFGDQDDPTSELSQALADYKVKRLKNNGGEFLNEAAGETGTDPNVFYLGQYGLTEPVSTPPVTKHIPAIIMSVYPNPARDYATLEFELDSVSGVTVSLYDLSGKEVLKLMEDERMNKGSHTVRIDTSRLKSGTYICRLITDGEAKTLNLIVEK